MSDTQQQPQPHFNIERIYVKDASFEAPNTPETFQSEWKPEMDVDLQTKTRKLDDYIYEVVLMLTVSVKNAEKIAFCVEVQQAGIFSIANFPAEQIGHVVGSICPGILYPYAREAISDWVSKGGFPQLLLVPVNFDALYLQHLSQQKQSQVEEPVSA